MNGNWASLYMTKTLGANSAVASLALTCFWGAVTVGRLFSPRSRNGFLRVASRSAALRGCGRVRGCGFVAEK
jgi:fucose permease